MRCCCCCTQSNYTAKCVCREIILQTPFSRHAAATRKMKVKPERDCQLGGFTVSVTTDDTLTEHWASTSSNAKKKTTYQHQLSQAN